MDSDDHPIEPGVHWNTQCRRAMQVLMAAWEEKGRNALWRVADCEDVLWLSVVWVQHDEHDVVVDIGLKPPPRGRKRPLIKSKTSKGLRILVTNSEQLNEIPKQFLYTNIYMTSAELSTSVRSVSTVGSRFLARCMLLTDIDLSPLFNVTKLGPNFLSDCVSVTALDISSLTNVTEIGEGFLNECTALKTIDVAALDKLTKIEGNFLWGCSSLTSVDNLGTLVANVKEIETGFLAECSSLTTADFTMMPPSDSDSSTTCSSVPVTTIRSGFLSGCSSVTTVDLTPMRNVTSVAYHFLYQCKSLKVVSIPSELSEDSPLCEFEKRPRR